MRLLTFLARTRLRLAACLLAPALFLLAAPGRAAAGEVLVYYANENSPEGLELENYDAFAAWLREIDTERTRKMAEVLLKDTIEFPAAVDAELRTLRDATCQGRLSRPVVVFTNRLARRRRCWVLRPNRAPQEEPFVLAATGDLVLDGNPLCRPEVFRSALFKVSRLFPPADHRYVLISKSHGSPNYALTVRLQRDFRNFSLEKLREEFEAPTTESTQIGVSKQQFFDIIEASGAERGMTFALIFIESCRGTLETTSVSRLPRNIDFLYTSGDRYLQYQTLDYPRLVQIAAQEGTFSAAIKQQLKQDYLSVSRTTAQGPRLGWCWFVPAILCGWLWWKQARRVGRRGGFRR